MLTYCNFASPFFFMAARLQSFSSLNSVKSKILPGAAAVTQRQFRSNLHTKAASSRWAKTPENFNNVLSWFAQVKYILLSFKGARTCLELSFHVFAQWLNYDIMNTIFTVV
jgi:hypothetical protein